MSDATRMDVIVVGAGIVGLAIADRLSSQGMKVLLVEERGLSASATGAGMGHIVVLDEDEASMDLSAHSKRRWQELADELPEEAGFRSAGTLWLAENAADMEAAESKAERFRARGITTLLLSADEVARREPSLRSGLAGGLLVEDDAVIYQPAAAAFFARRAQHHGLSLLCGQRVNRVSHGFVTLADTSVLEADVVVVAAGHATPRLVSGLGLGNFIRPRKGHLAITSRRSAFVRHQLIELGYLASAKGNADRSVAFNVQPRETGQLLIGSTRQFGDLDDSIDHEILAEMLARALAFLPGLASLNIHRTWTGFRPATDDGKPVIGALPQDPRTLIAAGHEGLGITTSLGTADLIAAMIQGTSHPVPAAPFSPSRLLSESLGA